MKRILQGLGIILMVVIMAFFITVAGVYGVSSYHFSRTFAVQPDTLAIPTDSEAVALGKRLTVVHGCKTCHGEDFGGQVIMDSFVTGRFVGPNLTTGQGGVGSTLSDADWVKAIRHGVTSSGRSVLFMPSDEYYFLNDSDLGAMIAYLKALPPVDRQLATMAPGPLMRALYLAGQLELVKAEVIDQTRPRLQLSPSVTAEYGDYLASSTCKGCHGAGLSGGPVHGAPPEWPPASNLTADKATGLGQWTEADFVKAMRQGQRPNGDLINPVMPWPDFAAFTDDELTALWLYTQSVPPKAMGNR